MESNPHNTTKLKRPGTGLCGLSYTTRLKDPAAALHAKESVEES
jgi:hypothetical protein